MIYIDGDSYINGDEINDHLLFSDHPGYFTYEEYSVPLNRNKSRQWFNSVRTTVPYDIWLSTQKLQKKDNLSSYLKKFNYNVKDDSVSGSSLAGITRRTINNLISSPVSYAIIGLTYPIRYEIFFNNYWHQISMANECTTIPYGKEFNKIRALCYSTETLFSDWELQLHYISTICREKNIKLIIINPFNEEEEIFKMFIECKTPVLSNIRYYYMFSMNNIAKNLPKNAKVMCPGAHYTREVHNELSKQIHDLISKG